MERVAIRPEPSATVLKCWHCGAGVHTKRVARYLYPGELRGTAIVEDWHRCRCGAFQNVRRVTEIRIRSVRSAEEN